MPPTSTRLKWHDEAGKWIGKWMGFLNFYQDQYESIDQYVASKFRKHISSNSFLKADLSDTAVCAWGHVTRQQLLISDILEENRELSLKLVERDAQVIKLQEKLLESKDVQLQTLTSTVQTAVRDSVEKSYCDVASRVPAQTQPVISPTAINRAVKDFAESEERAKHLVVFGLKEEEGEEVISETIGEVFESLGEKPRPESVLRLGMKKSEHVRPVLVKLRTAAAAYGVLKKSQGLRNTDKFNRVYISPDRTKSQRIERRELVSRMKQQAEQNKSRRYFIRDGEIESEGRGSGKSGGNKSEDETDSSGSREEESDASDHENSD